MSGTLIGGGPGRWASGGRNSDAQKAWELSMREQGKSPYSIMVGDTAVPFDRFGEPISIVLRMAADMGMYSSYVSQGAQEEWMAGLATVMVSGLYQASFLKGINDVVDIISDPSATFGKKGGRTVQNWMATQTPFGGLLNYVDKVTDPYKHSYEGATFAEVMRVHEDTFGTGIFAKIADRIPGFAGTPAMVDQIAGALVPAVPGGGPSGLNPLQMAVPFMPRGIKGADDVWTAIYAIKGSYQEKRPTDMRLTNAEQQDLNARMSRMVINGKTVRESILEYYNSSAVQRYVKNRGAAFSDVRTNVEKGFDQIVNDYYQAALTDLGVSNRQVRERALLIEGRKQAAQTGNFDEARSIDTRIDELFQDARLRGVF